MPGGGPGLDVGAADPEVESLGARRIPFVFQSEQDNMLRYHVSLLSHCLNVGLPLDVWPTVRAKDRLGVFKQLRTLGFWREFPARGRSGVLLIPSILVAGGIRPLFGAGEPDGPPRVFPETLVADGGLLWCENLGLIGHLTKLQQVCDQNANPR